MRFAFAPFHVSARIHADHWAMFWSSFSLSFYLSPFYPSQTLTTTGYGDFVLVKDNERILAMIVLVLGATMFSYVVAHISDLIQSFNQAEVRDG
jgi:Ion channel